MYGQAGSVEVQRHHFKFNTTHLVHTLKDVYFYGFEILRVLRFKSSGLFLKQSKNLLYLYAGLWDETNDEEKNAARKMGDRLFDSLSLVAVGLLVWQHAVG